MNGILLPMEVLANIRAHVLQACPEEACGLLCGTSGGEIRVCSAHRSRNVTESDRRTSYLVDPGLQLELQRKHRGSRMAVIGGYHSHPAGSPRPSARDQETALTGFIYLIAAPESEKEIRFGVFRSPGPGCALEEIAVTVTEAVFDPGKGMQRDLDLRGEVCPYTFIRAKLALESLSVGDVLAITLDHPPAFETMPRSLRAEGQTILGIERRGALVTVRVRKEWQAEPL